jgi:hypothetical protein
MDEDRIDFYALDPKRNSGRFERMVQAVVAGARSPAVLSQLLFGLVAWGRGAVAVAALLALAAWVPSLGGIGLSDANSPLTAGTDPVELVSSWATTDDVPPEIDLGQAMGGLYGQ